jgi:hypothetical protein
MAGGHCVGSSLAEELGSMQGQGARHTTLRARGTGSVGDGVGRARWRQGRWAKAEMLLLMLMLTAARPSRAPIPRARSCRACISRAPMPLSMPGRLGDAASHAGSHAASHAGSHTLARTLARTRTASHGRGRARDEIVGARCRPGLLCRFVQRASTREQVSRGIAPTISPTAARPARSCAWWTLRLRAGGPLSLLLANSTYRAARDGCSVHGVHAS